MFVEFCAGCGAVANEHPVIGVEAGAPSSTIANPATKGGRVPDTSGTGRVLPVCVACHTDPTHRTKDRLKCSFWLRADAPKEALAALKRAKVQD